MDDVAYVSALALAVVFVWAGVAKLTARATTTAGFAALGLPAPASAAVAVPVAELVLAVGLVVEPAVSAGVAAALLVAFSLVLVRAVARGVRVGCGCFGASRRERIAPTDLVRNGALLAGAVVATAAPGPLVPSLAAVLAVGGAVVVVGMVLALVDLRAVAGGVLRGASPGDGVFAGLPDAGRAPRRRRRVAAGGRS